MSKTFFYILHELLHSYIQKKFTQFREFISLKRRFAIFLYHIIFDVTFFVILNQFACEKNIVCEIIFDIVNAIIQHLTKKYIRFSITEKVIRSTKF